MAGGESVEGRVRDLHKATEQIAAAETEQEVCEVAVRAVTAVFDVPFGGLWLYDADATRLQLTAATDRSADLLVTDSVDRDDDISWDAFGDGEVRAYSGASLGTARYGSDSGIGSEMVLPLGEHGVLNVGSREADAFGSTEVAVAGLLATNVEAALTNTEREHALRVKNERLAEVVGIASHDLRNPLNVASGHLTLARDDRDDENLAKVADAIDRMETLIDDMLTISEQGYVVESRTSIDLAGLAEQAWSTVHTPEATLQIDGTAELFGDETRLLQVFENLFRNAVEHGSTSPDSQARRDAVEHGGEDVTVRVGPIRTMHTATRVSASDHVDGFYVEDDGPGIPEEQREHVFDPGYSDGSTGLGLAIVGRVVTAHGWEVTAEEAVGGGARFEVTDEAKPVIPFD